MVCHEQLQCSTETGRSNFVPVTKNPLSPVEHPGGLGVNCELFELGVEQFVVRNIGCIFILPSANRRLCRLHLFRIKSEDFATRPTAVD